jgi:VanZ family protein
MSSSAYLSQRQARFWISAWWPVALGVLIICVESTQFMGADHTSHPLRVVWQFLFGHVSDASWEHIHHILRKSGHFFGYGFLALTWLRAWRKTFPRALWLAHAVLALVGTAFIASSDEFHQSFLPNRTSSVWDVLLDCTGAFVLLSLAYLITLVARPRRIARAA